ncbi:ergothioneine biosynthesis protein EgtB [Dyadobacter fermentans]|uniref:ergothioneine biosynthesis protein EgtB n=1 Tax=Dyadobacter fermentans TaxID=94254 RepID=UPI001CBDC88E|nr:ergothioneine biosynthesis protein EgtB [Dyadobacter fermentans]MBZ1360405.1 ergothioneine biosynthesis protein EgtB [Dyadobacter fermentans]
MQTRTQVQVLRERYEQVRRLTVDICQGLETEDYVVQPTADVSPPKWHLGHTTWFFETFVLKPHCPDYHPFSEDFDYVFNSYYETIGRRVVRTDRGNLSRPTVQDVFRYRHYVDEKLYQLIELASADLLTEMSPIIELGINHEQQHQELLWTDIKYILGNNPLFPRFLNSQHPDTTDRYSDQGFLSINSGNYEIGYAGPVFSWDNEHNRHTVYLQQFEICTTLVTNKEYLQFIDSGGYTDFRHWHSDGWAWVKTHQIQAPLYWYYWEGEWLNYTFDGLRAIDLQAHVCHVSYYEAYAYANWMGLRLPTEFEWEVAAPKMQWGQRWEWTESAYLPYPGYKRPAGALGEYNGKFMVNQQVLRGASTYTSPGHSRITYRNFFQPQARWQFSGIRTVRP